MSYVTGISGNVISAASAGWAPTNSAEVSAIASAYATGGAQVVTAVGTETAYTPDGVSDVVTSINGNYISALSADSASLAEYDDRGRLLTSLASESEVSAIASAYAESSQVVTSLQYATSESATVATTVTADTVVGNGARDISAEYYDYGYGSWIEYDSSKPLVQVRMTAVGNMANYSSNPYYLYVVPYGATNDGNVSTTSQLTDALSFGEFSGGMNDLIIAEGTGSANSQDPYVVEVNFNVTSVPFWGSEPAYWGTVTGESYAAVDNNEYTRPVFCVAGGYDGSQLFELRNNATAELDFGSIVTVSAVSGINELEIAGAGGGIDSATVSAIASSYAESAVSSKADSSALSSYAMSADVSGTVDLVSTQSANWGGSALALSAGPGVKLEKVGDTLVAGLDETLLWSGANASSAQLSESYTNFERLSFVVGFPAQAGHVLTFDVGSMATAFNLLFPFGNTYAYFCNAKASFTTTGTVQVSDAKYVYTPFGTSTQVTTETSNVSNAKTCLQKIIGIHRTAEA